MSGLGTLLASLALLCLSQTAEAEVSLQLRLYNLTSDPLLTCNDGTPGGYYYREATDPQYDDRWIFYLEGGGWCWNATSCEKRIKSNGNSLSRFSFLILSYCNQFD